MASKRPRNEISIAEDLLRYKVTSTPDESKNESDLVKAKENADKAMSRLRRSLEAKNLPAMHDKPTYDAENNRVFNYLDVPKASINSLASSSGTSSQEFLDSLYLGTKVGGEIKDGGDDNVGNDEKPDSSTSNLKHLKYTVAASDLNSSHRKDLGLALKDEASVLDNAFTQSTGSGFQVDFYIPQEAYQEYYDAAKDAYLAKYACADLADESVQIKINKAASKNFIHDKFASTLKLQRKFRSAETREAKKAAKEKQEEQRKKLEKKYIDAQAKESIQREKLSAKQKADREKLAQQLRKFAAAKHLDLDKLPEANMEGLSENQVEARKNTLIGILGSEKGKDGIPFADVLTPYADILSKDQQLSLLEQLKADAYVDPEAQRRARVFTAQNGIQLDKAAKFGKRTSNKIANSYFNKTGFDASDTYIEDVKQQQIKKLSEKRFKTGKYKGQLLGDILAPYTDGMSTDEQLYALSKFKGNDRGKRNSDIAKSALAVGGLGLAAFGKGLSGITKAINNGWRTFKSLTSRILGTIGVIAALSTQAVSLLRRGVLNVVNNAKETVSNFKSARELGIPLWRVQQMNDADVRRGLEKGTSTKAIAKINEIGTDVLNIDEGALSKLAPVAKGEIESLILSKKPYEAMEKIINAYYSLGSGKDGVYYDTVGNPTTKLNSQEVLVSNLRRVSPEMADLLSTLFQMNDDPSQYKLEEVTGLADYYKVQNLATIGKSGISNAADLSVTLKYDNFKADFNAILDRFKTSFSQEVEKIIGLLDTGVKATLGTPKETLDTVAAHRKENATTLAQASSSEKVFATAFLNEAHKVQGLKNKSDDELFKLSVLTYKESSSPASLRNIALLKQTIEKEKKSLDNVIKGKDGKDLNLKVSDFFRQTKNGIMLTNLARQGGQVFDVMLNRLRGTSAFKDLTAYQDMPIGELFNLIFAIDTYANSLAANPMLRQRSTGYAVAHKMYEKAQKDDYNMNSLGDSTVYQQELLDALTKAYETTSVIITNTTGDNKQLKTTNVGKAFRYAKEVGLDDVATEQRKSLLSAERLAYDKELSDYLGEDSNGDLVLARLRDKNGNYRSTEMNDKMLKTWYTDLKVDSLEDLDYLKKKSNWSAKDYQAVENRVGELLETYNIINSSKDSAKMWKSLGTIANATTVGGAKNIAIGKFMDTYGLQNVLSSQQIIHFTDYLKESKTLASPEAFRNFILDTSAYGMSDWFGDDEISKNFMSKAVGELLSVLTNKGDSKAARQALMALTLSGNTDAEQLVLTGQLYNAIGEEGIRNAINKEASSPEEAEQMFNSGEYLKYLHTVYDTDNNVLNFYLDFTLNDDKVGTFMFKMPYKDSRNSAELSLNLDSQNNVINSATQARQFANS
jgi:hypothetical protein